MRRGFIYGSVLTNIGALLFFTNCSIFCSILLFAVLAVQPYCSAEVQFERDIVPVLQTKCLPCHDSKTRKGGLNLQTMSAVLEGGQNGRVVVPGNLQESLLYTRLVAGEMPPENETALTPDELLLFEDWIKSIRAHSPVELRTVEKSQPGSFQAFRVLRRPPVPELMDTRQARTEIDRFVLSKLHDKKLHLSDDAQPAKIVRRLYFDLIGLPPDPETVHSYVRDSASHAYERVIDQLLSDPRYGERWARHWLDTVGYTDTVSYDGDTNFVPGFIEGRWRYRDYVIDAFNSDTPYDRFLTEQIAGDEMVNWRDEEDVLTSEMIRVLAATGFWRNSEDRSGSAKEIEYKWSLLHNTMETFGTSLLGLTLRCARCHSHKYEPISQEDYYRLLSLITPAFNIENWKAPKERALPAISSGEKKRIDDANRAVEEVVEQLKQQILKIRKTVENRVRAGKLKEVPEDLRDALLVAFALAEKDRDEKQRTLLKQFSLSVTVTEEEIDEAISADEKNQVASVQQAMDTKQKEKQTYGWIQAVYDVGPPPVTRLLIRGDHKRPGEEVRPGFLSVLSDPSYTDTLEVNRPRGSSGRRTALAQWLTRNRTPASGLASRVIVNRIWQHLIGVGIVGSSENLGLSGQRPTHPDLLEWLASELVENGWHIKSLIKKIVMSSVYRQASGRDAYRVDAGEEPELVDPGNELLWHGNLRRLESEAIRDSMLVVSGAFQRQMGGRPVPLQYSKDGTAAFDIDQMDRPLERWRRSVYLFQRRVYHLNIMSVFDQPVVAGATCRRNKSSVALQSLTMLNDDLVLEYADEFAKRVYSITGDVLDDQVEMCFQLALSRSPSSDEIKWCRELLQQQGTLYQKEAISGFEARKKALMHLCRAMFNTTEFLYVE